MANENGFRGKLFGGFNRKDVAAYIEKLAAERNALNTELGRRTAELNSCIAQNTELSLRLGEAQLIARQSNEQIADSNAQADAKCAQLQERVDALEKELGEKSGRLEQAETRLSETEAALADALRRAEEAEALANSRRVIALEEAVETLRGLGAECAQSAELTEAVADRANGEFWKVTAALDNLSAQVRSAAQQFGAMADNISGGMEAN